MCDVGSIVKIQLRSILQVDFPRFHTQNKNYYKEMFSVLSKDFETIYAKVVFHYSLNLKRAGGHFSTIRLVDKKVTEVFYSIPLVDKKHYVMRNQ